jgi:alkaline phosphatase
VGEMKESRVLILKSMIRMVHSQGKMIRFWGNPDVPEVWELLLKLRVDLINTDRIEDFSKFYREYSKN